MLVIHLSVIFLQIYLCQDAQGSLVTSIPFTLKHRELVREHQIHTHSHTIIQYTIILLYHLEWYKCWYLFRAASYTAACLSPSPSISVVSHCQSVSLSLSLSLHCQATHPNMRTYYFCTDTAKEMESWMKVMTDAALVHSEPVRRSVLTTETQISLYMIPISNNIVLTSLMLRSGNIAPLFTSFWKFKKVSKKQRTSNMPTL